MQSDVALVRQVIPVTCPVTRLRITQACRGKNCTHPAAFCATALQSIRVCAPVGAAYRCPLCDSAIPADGVCVDGPLTVFLSQYLDATAISARRISGGAWAYHKASVRVVKNKVRGASRDAFDAECQHSPASHDTKYQRSHEVEPSSSISSVGPATNGEQPHWAAVGAAAAAVLEWQRPRRTVPPRPTLLPPDVQLKLGSSAKPPSTRRTAEDARHLVEVPAVGAGQREDGHSRRARGSTGLPSSLALAWKSERRLKRKAHKARAALLEAAHKELIKRALWEDHPELRGESLW